MRDLLGRNVSVGDCVATWYIDHDIVSMIPGMVKEVSRFGCVIHALLGVHVESMPVSDMQLVVVPENELPSWIKENLPGGLFWKG